MQTRDEKIYLIKYTSSCREDQRLSTEGKIVSKYCNISIIQGRGSISSPLYHSGGINLCVRPRVNFPCETLMFRLLGYEVFKLHLRQLDAPHEGLRKTKRKHTRKGNY